MTDPWADGFTCTIEQASLTYAQNYYLVMYNVGVAICSLAQSKGGRLIE